MKARIKKTGEIINIASYAKIDLDICNSFGNPVSVSPEEIELIQEQTENIDWEQRRYEIAKAAIQGVCNEYEDVPDPKNSQRFFAEFAVAFADTLIEELKKK